MKYFYLLGMLLLIKGMVLLQGMWHSLTFIGIGGDLFNF